MAIDFGAISLFWDVPPPVDQRVEIEERVRADMAQNLEFLDDPANLLFHYIPLTATRWRGPIVFVYVRDGAFRLKYDADPRYVSLKDGQLV